MTFFDICFYNMVQYYKKKNRNYAVNIASLYISVLQCSLILLLGVFLAKFLKVMYVDTMSVANAWVLYIIICVLLGFKNWMQYTGKKRNIIHAKMIQKHDATYNIWVLCLAPILILGLSFALYQAI